MLALFGISWLAVAIFGAMAASTLIKPPKIETPPPPIPTAVPTVGVEGEAAISRRLRKRVSGRAKTIVTGDLTPEGIGKKTLLG